MKPTVALALFLSAPAHAVCIDVRAAAGFVSAETGLGSLPACLVIERESFAARRGVMLSQAGAYDPATDRISLAPDLDLGSVLGQSYLVHEMVHMAQFRNNVPASCPAEREAEAYRVQIAYLALHGEGREALLLQFAVAGLLTCASADQEY